MSPSDNSSQKTPDNKGAANNKAAANNKPTKTMKKSQMKIWFLIPLIVFAGFVVMLLSDTSRIMTNDNLPDQPFLMNIWGSWCPTCIIEHPFLMQLEERGVNLVGVNYKDDIGNALGYLNRGGDPFSMSIQDLSGQFALDLGLTGAPETFVVDGEGIIRQHIVGEINESNWQSRITPCLMLLNEADKNNVSPDATQVKEMCK